MKLIINGDVSPENNFLILNGNFNFETSQYGGFKSNIYVLREKNTLDGCFSHAHLGLVESGYEEELFNLMIPNFLEHFVGAKQSKIGIPKSEEIYPLQILGFGPHISKKAESLAESWGFDKINILFSDFNESKLEKEFYENPENHKYFSGNFHTDGIGNYSTKSGKFVIKIVDDKSVHNGITYENSQSLKFEGELSNAPRHLRRDKDDNIILEGLERLIEGGIYPVLIKNSAGIEGQQEEDYTERGIYLGRSGEEQTHKLFLSSPIFHKNTNKIFQVASGTNFYQAIVEFADYKLSSRGILSLENPKVFNLSEREREYLLKRYPVEIQMNNNP